MSDYNSRYSGSKIEELLGQIPNLAKADLSNAMTVSLNQNGYAKFNNGLLIQWGYSSSSGKNKTIYMPTSFYNINYSVVLTLKRTTDDTTNLTCDVYRQSVSSFTMYGLYHATDSNNGAYWSGFYWMAIGRWK